MSVPQSCWMHRSWLFLDTVWVWKTYSTAAIQFTITDISKNQLLWMSLIFSTLGRIFPKNKKSLWCSQIDQKCKNGQYPIQLSRNGSFLTQQPPQSIYNSSNIPVAISPSIAALLWCWIMERDAPQSCIHTYHNFSSSHSGCYWDVTAMYYFFFFLSCRGAVSFSLPIATSSSCFHRHTGSNEILDF